MIIIVNFKSCNQGHLYSFYELILNLMSVEYYLVMALAIMIMMEQMKEMLIGLTLTSITQFILIR